jgi:hypothetical protein
MIRSALLLIRTSVFSVFVLAGALMTLVDALWSEPGDDNDVVGSSIPSLAPLPKSGAPAGAAAAALRIPLFDPERRPETLAGSIDDLRLSSPSPPQSPVDVAISGVMVGGGKRRAMLAVAGGRSAWSDVGAEVGGWRVTAVDADGALLERDGQTLALKIADRLKNRSKPRATDGAAGAGTTDQPLANNAPQPPDAGGPSPLTPPDAVDSQHP